jgi:CubicO group peptidase (beta-lactamase class C family)
MPRVHRSGFRSARSTGAEDTFAGSTFIDVGGAICNHRHYAGNSLALTVGADPEIPKRWRAHSEVMTIDTVFSMASTTKAITGTAVMQCVEEGKLDLDDPAKRK